MGRRVVHIMTIEMDKIKPGDLYESFCGHRYIAEEAPTAEQCAKIEAAWADVPVCKRCKKEQARRKASVWHPVKKCEAQP